MSTTRTSRRSGTGKPPSRQRLHAVLQRHLPGSLTEVLLPALQWRITPQRITAIVPNQVWEDLFATHCLEPLQKAAFPRIEEIRVVSRLVEESHPAFRQQTFTNLLPDPGNEFPISAGRQVLEAPGLEHNPFYIHGPPGAGKSHLLAALAHAYRSTLGREHVLECSGGEWVGSWAMELSERGDSPRRDQLARVAVICIDDLQLLAKRTVAQEQLFHLINDAMERGQQLILAGNAPPKHLGLEERVSSRLGWGLTVAVDIPKVETRAALLRELAGPVIDDLDSDELGRLIEALAPDMHQVVSLGERFLRGERVSLGEDKASFDRVLEAVADHYGVRAGDIAGKRRHRSIALARQTALLLGRRLTGHSLEALGGMVGGRDHSTVLYLVRQAETKAAQDVEFRRLVNDLTQRVLA